MSNEITWRLENENIGRLLVHYAIPAVIGTMVNALYNIVDRIFIGQGVGALAISGLTLTFPILLFMQAFGMLIGAGAATRVSIHLGRKANDLADNVLGNAFTLTFIIGALTIIPSMIFLDDLLMWFGGSEQTIPYAKDYLYIAIPGNLLATLSFSFNAVMRASGYPKKAMFTMMIGAVLNVILDPIFILEYIYDRHVSIFHAAGGQCGCGDHEPCVEREWRRFGDWCQRYYFQYRHAAGYVDYRYRPRDATDCRV